MSVLLAACGSVGDRVAATVDGEEITVDDVLAAYPIGEDEDVISSDTFRSNLTNVIIGEVILSAAEDEYDITATEDEIETQYQDFVSQLEASDPDGDYQAALDAAGLTDLRVRQAAEEQIVANTLQERLAEDVPGVTDEDVETEFEANADLYRNACVRHILVETEEEAQDVKTRLEEGEDFAVVAGEVSIEPQAAETGGDLGCSNLSRYVPEFIEGVTAAEVGEVTDPVESEFGWHVILVDEIDDDAAVRETIRTQLETTGETAFFQDWILQALEDADVSVDEDFGTWVTDPQPGIVGPDDGTETTGTTGAETSETTSG